MSEDKDKCDGGPDNNQRSKIIEGKVIVIMYPPALVEFGL